MDHGLLSQVVNADTVNGFLKDVCANNYAEGAFSNTFLQQWLRGLWKKGAPGKVIMLESCWWLGNSKIEWEVSQITQQSLPQEDSQQKTNCHKHVQNMTCWHLPLHNSFRGPSYTKLIVWWPRVSSWSHPRCGDYQCLLKFFDPRNILLWWFNHIVIW